MSKSNLDDQVKKLSAKPDRKPKEARGGNAVLSNTNKQHSKSLRRTEGGKINTRKYQIYCNKQHLLYLTREECYRTVVKGHVITTLRIHEFTPFGLRRGTAIGEENE